MKAPVLSLGEFEMKCWKYYTKKCPVPLTAYSNAVHTYNLLLNTKVEKDHFVRLNYAYGEKANREWVSLFILNNDDPNTNAYYPQCIDMPVGNMRTDMWDFNSSSPLLPLRS